MQISTRPLPDTHPQFTVTGFPGFVEYRVENWKLATDGSGRKIYGTLQWSRFLILFAPVILSFIFMKTYRNPIQAYLLVIIFAGFVWKMSTQVLSESVILIEPHGIQLETSRGLPPWPLMTSRRFIPTSDLQDIIINEGLYGWNVRYYLAALKMSDLSLTVIFENTLPRFPVLIHIYQGIHSSLFAVNNHERADQRQQHSNFPNGTIISENE